jgi:hypothetical protein
MRVSAAPNQTVAKPSNFLLSKMPANRRAKAQSGARLRVLGKHLGGGGGSGRRGGRAMPAPAPASRDPTTLANGETFKWWGAAAGESVIKSGQAPQDFDSSRFFCERVDHLGDAGGAFFAGGARAYAKYIMLCLRQRAPHYV